MSIKEDSGILVRGEEEIHSIDDLRVEIIKAAERILTVSGGFLATKDRKVVGAMRAFWQQDDGTQLQRLLELVRREP